MPARIILADSVAEILEQEARHALEEYKERAAVLIGSCGLRTFFANGIVGHKILQERGIILKRGLRIRNGITHNYIKWDSGKLSDALATKWLQGSERALLSHAHVSGRAIDTYPSTRDIENSLLSGYPGITFNYERSQKRLVAVGYCGQKYIPVFARGVLLLEDKWTYIQKYGKKI